jgi:hypothetical protein
LSNFSGQLCRPGVLDKDLIVWLNGATPANTCIPPSILGTCLHSHTAYPPQKMFVRIKNRFIWGNHFKIKNKQKSKFDKLSFGKCKI